MNIYYDWWKQNKSLLSLVPAIVFWATSMIFFIVGMSFENPMIVFGRDVSIAIAVALSFSNTIIQIIGNEQDDLDNVMRTIWLASYALGIGTNIYGLMIVLNMNNTWLEAIVSVSLGVMIEISPEKLFVQFLKGWSAKPKKLHSVNNRSTYKPQHKPSFSHNPDPKFMKPIRQNERPITQADLPFTPPWKQ